jgi:DNA-binding transcriptional ArsR family regulator
MTEKQVVIDLNDPRSTKIAEALANPTAKKILNLLAESELSATDIANKLKIPLNTATYNLDNLTKSGLIEPTNKFLWSVKGKKINSYRLSNKKIVISPKSFSMKGIIPAILGTALVATLVKLFSSSISSIQSSNDVINTLSSEVSPRAADMAAAGTSELAKMISPDYYQPIVQACSSQPIWAWFLLGGLCALLIVLIWNSISNKVKGGNINEE